MVPKIRLISFYLPQYHPIPENDAWWGNGFTEWTNVVKAKPLFKDHFQPHLPSDLGFYDLRLPEVRKGQADLAKNYGIYGFCYYHYWFNGKRLLERPFQEVLESGQPEFPFCLCWANENWTRTWDGQDQQILIEQHYSKEDDVKHIRSLLNAFSDPRYIRHQGKPIFLVYKASLLPNSKQTTDIWREEAIKSGLGELFLCNVESTGREYLDPAKAGFDAAVEFQPEWKLLKKPIRRSILWRLLAKFGISSKAYIERKIFYYDFLVKSAINKPPSPYLSYPCVTPMWDNSPRKRIGGVVLHKSSPESYEYWLSEAIKKAKMLDDPEPFVFINAWNEWGEGNHLEPDNRYGYKYLEATKKAIQSNTNQPV